MKTNNILNEVLARHGIEDASEFLSTKTEGVCVKRSTDPDVRMRGNVQMMKQKKISRQQVKIGFETLEYL